MLGKIIFGIPKAKKIYFETHTLTIHNLQGKSFLWRYQNFTFSSFSWLSIFQEYFTNSGQPRDTCLGTIDMRPGNNFKEEMPYHGLNNEWSWIIDEKWEYAVFCWEYRWLWLHIRPIIRPGEIYKDLFHMDHLHNIQTYTSYTLPYMICVHITL